MLLQKMRVFRRLQKIDSHDLGWEIWVLLALFVTVFGIMTRESGKKAYATQIVAHSWQDEAHDPYDILSESVEERSNGIETGL